eukprot:TRINITY_DN9440_c0_g1_i1.p1 TRINITY_DN9440_c0_g1~~TRINITY_DN9440_c0_g1_i1.p1  ORF type:complete len:522 (+),score=131.53 TRINITY_DN9440_c0_g1_i1:65-1630(+)
MLVIDSRVMVVMVVVDALCLYYIMGDHLKPDSAHFIKYEAPPTLPPRVSFNATGLCADTLALGQPWVDKDGKGCRNFTTLEDCNANEDARVACCACGGGDEFVKGIIPGFPLPADRGRAAYFDSRDPVQVQPVVLAPQAEIPEVKPQKPSVQGPAKDPKVEAWVKWITAKTEAFYKAAAGGKPEPMTPDTPLCTPKWDVQALKEGQTAYDASDHLKYHGYTHNQDEEHKYADHSWNWIWCQELVKAQSGASCGVRPRKLADCLPDGATLSVIGPTTTSLVALKMSVDINNAGQVPEPTTPGRMKVVGKDSKSYTLHRQDGGHREGPNAVFNSLQHAKAGDVLVIQIGESYKPWEEKLVKRHEGASYLHAAAEKAVPAWLPKDVAPLFLMLYVDLSQLLLIIRKEAAARGVKIVLAPSVPEFFASSLLGVIPDEAERKENPSASHCVGNDAPVSPIREYILARALSDHGIDIVDAVVDLASAVRSVPHTAAPTPKGMCSSVCGDINIALADMVAGAVCQVST